MVYRALDHITSGVEDIIGYHGRHWWIQKLREINAKYINPIFTRNAIKTYDEEIIRIFNRMAIKELILHSTFFIIRFFAYCPIRYHMVHVIHTMINVKSK